METLLNDPVVRAAGGIIALGLLLLVWTLRSLLKSTAPKVVPLPLDDIQGAFPDLPPTPSDLPFGSAAAVTNDPEPVNKAMAERLTTMTQRLADMQVQLNRQTAALSVATASVLAPEALDKMILVVNTVIQQVDSLQKSLDGAAAHPLSAAPSVAAMPTPAPTPAAAPAPAQTPRPTASATSAPVAASTPTIPVSEIISKQNPTA